MTSDSITQRICGRYVLGELLGHGGMADVYAAEDTALGRRIALKLMREPTGDNDRARFLSEARTLAALDHPGVVTVLDVGEWEDRPFLTMELVEGAPPTTDAGAWAPEDVARLGAEIAKALAYVHREGVIHRDIKPENILVDADHAPRITDFGIARVIGDTVHHTQAGTTIGTAAYIAPEQVRGDEVTTACDIYSLGLVLLELLTGRRTFPGPPLEAAMARLQGDPAIPAGLPSPWRSLLAQMTSSDPGQRPTARQVAAVLEALADPVDPDATQLLTLTPQRERADERPGRRKAPRPPRARAFPPAVAAVGAVIGVVALLFVLVATLGRGVADPEPLDGQPSGIPTSLQGPLQELRDAVNGEPR